MRFLVHLFTCSCIGQDQNEAEFILVCGDTWRFTLLHAALLLTGTRISALKDF